MLKKQKFKVILERLSPKLKNKEELNPQLIVTFSGIPGSGKTTIAKKLEQKFKAVRLNNDFIRDIISKENLESSRENIEELLQEFNVYFIENYSFRNKLLVLDKSMDRRYDIFFPLFKKLNLNYFVIRVDYSKEGAISRIINREPKINKKWLIDTMERWKREFDDFGTNSRWDLLVDGKEINYSVLYKTLKNLLTF